MAAIGPAAAVRVAFGQPAFCRRAVKRFFFINFCFLNLFKHYRSCHAWIWLLLKLENNLMEQDNFRFFIPEVFYV